jgi:hypothetical protein
MTLAAGVGFAQDFFRFVYRVGSPISYGIKINLPEVPEVRVFGKHSLAAAEYEMPEESFGLCGTILERLESLSAALTNMFVSTTSLIQAARVRLPSGSA